MSRRNRELAYQAGSTLIGPIKVGPITHDAVRRFAEVSGDRNAIHLDPETAQRAGLAEPPVYGMQLVAYMHSAAERFRPDMMVKSLSTRFLAPVPVGDTVEISGRIVKVDGAAQLAIMRLFLKNGAGALASLGEAVLVASSPGEARA